MIVLKTLIALMSVVSFEGFSESNKSAFAKEAFPAEFRCFPYPLKDPEEVFKGLGKEKITIFAYGSLLNRESALRTLSPEVMESYQPALVFGYSRVFDRHVPTTKKWGERKRMNDTAMLNLFENDGMVNGVIFEVGIEDFKQIVKREEGYDLVPVAAKPLGGNREPFLVYTFIASTKTRDGNLYTNNKINPVPGYALASLEGAAEWGESFEKFWIESTYLSDRKTPFADWIKDPSIDMENH